MTCTTSEGHFVRIVRVNVGQRSEADEGENEER